MCRFYKHLCRGRGWYSVGLDGYIVWRREDYRALHFCLEVMVGEEHIVLGDDGGDQM